jgi:hypothetical protein
MDEIFGYFPPVANPPSKAPLLTLLKQARAYGLGVVLATQNPVDLDYKGLANTGTWFIGRLQTERDKARVLEGLEGAAASAGGSFDRQAMDQILAGLGNRVFLMNNVHEDAPEVFQTRWVMSYLRGPLTRVQIKTLMDPHKAQTTAPVAAPAATAAAPAAATTPTAPTPSAPAAAMPPVETEAAPAAALGGARPAVPPEVNQLFVPLRGAAPGGARLVYRPALAGLARINFVDSKTRVDVLRDRLALTAVTEDVIPVDWAAGRIVDLAPNDLDKAPRPEAEFGDLPPAAVKPKSYAAWTKEMVSWLYGNEVLELFTSPRHKLVSRPDESERDFRIRLQQVAHEARDAAAGKLRAKYAPKIASLQDRIRVAQQAVEREKEQAKQQKMQTAISFGATLLGAFVGRKAVSTSTVGRATTAVRGASRAAKEQQDIERAGDTVEALQKRLADLEAEFKRELEALDDASNAQTEILDTLSLKPKKSNISVQLLALAWVPHWRDAQGTLTPAWE